MKAQRWHRFRAFLVIGCWLLAASPAYAMHISEGILPWDWALLWFVVATPFVAYGLHRLKKLSSADLSFKPLVEGGYCKGSVLLSLLHFDTPSDKNGGTVLCNIWRYFGCAISSQTVSELSAVGGGESGSAPDIGMADIRNATDALIEHGLRNFLWYRRNPMLLLWRRGIRGLEYCTLSVMVNEMAALLEKRTSLSALPEIVRQIRRIRALALPFAAKASELLLRERFAMLNEHITYDRCGDPKIVSLREELFFRSKSYGGVFKELIDEIDRLLSQILARREAEKDNGWDFSPKTLILTVASCHEPNRQICNYHSL